MILWLLGGVLVGAGLFASTLFSLYQSVTQRGALRLAHIGAAMMTLVGISSLSLVSPQMALVAGAALALVAAFAFFLDKGWNRLLPLFQIAFALMLILGLPFQ